MERKEQAEDRVPRSPSKAENPANSTNTFHEFRWTYGGSQVRVTGDFMGWGEGLKMTRAPDGAFYLTCTLPADQMIKYKYIVDGQWKIDPAAPTKTDESGNVNNIIRVRLHTAPPASPRVSPIQELFNEWNLETGTRHGMKRSVSYSDTEREDSDRGHLGISFRSFHPLSSRSIPKEQTVGQVSVKREGKLVLAMVGLPARGKTYIARKLQRHLTWMGHKTKIFNVGNYRRQILGAAQKHEFFDPTNTEGMQKRREMALAAFEDMVENLSSDTDIAVYDATNTTRARRKWLLESLQASGLATKLIFIESICTDDNLISSNIRETKLKSPDYKECSPEEAVRDFLQRIDHYRAVYETIDDEEEMPYVKLIDAGRKIVSYDVRGYLHSRITLFLSNLCITPRSIFITRHGESEFNVAGKIGGDSNLSPLGSKYAERLAAFFSKRYPENEDLMVWTSTLKRTMQTAAGIERDIVTWRNLDEIDAGICDGMTYEEVAEKMPEEYEARKKDKFRYRYPRGESYQDIVYRLEPVILELMRTDKPVLIISHQATLRVLYSYLTDLDPPRCPSLLMPLHTVIELVPKAYGCEEIRHVLMK